MTIRKSFCLFSAAATLLLTSCETTQPVANNTTIGDIQIEPSLPEPPEPIIIAPPPEPVSTYKRYKDFIDGIVLTMASAPKATAKGHAFSSPFSVKVTKSADGTPAEGIELTVRYPVAKADDEIQYAETTITSNGNGTANFTPPVPQTTVNGTVTIFPAGDTSDPDIAAAAQLASVTAAYQVRTNLLQSGGCIAIVDCTPSGTPITARSDSSSGVLTEMMKKGFTRVGNIDFVTEVMSGDKNRVYQAAKPMIGGTTAFLAFGTVRYGQPTQKTDSGCTCTLTGNITCLNMKDGSVLYHTTRTATASDAREQQALSKARADLTRQIADAVYYGL